MHGLSATPGLALAARPVPHHRGRLEPGRLQGPPRPALGGDRRLHRLARRRPPPPGLRLSARLRFPYSVVSAGQLKLPIHYAAYGDGSDPGPFPVPPNAPVEGGNGSHGDRHVLVVDRSACRLYELYRAFYIAKPRPHWNAASGAEWDLRSARRRPDSWTSADAAGLPIFPGLVRYGEVASDHLDHAIRVTFDNTRDAWIHPTTHCAGDTSSGDAPAMGTRLRLKAGYGLGGFKGAARTIALAMKRYGLIVADNGSNWYLSGNSDKRWDDEGLDQLKRIPGSAFEVVRSAGRPHPC